MKQYFEYGTSATASGPEEVGTENRLDKSEKVAEDERGDNAASRTPDEAESVGSQPSVIVSVRRGDSTMLQAIIDRTASQQRIMGDLRRELRRFAVPYRSDLDRKILDAIRVHLVDGATFEEASICMFGNPDSARAIRYWRNKWGLR